MFTFILKILQIHCKTENFVTHREFSLVFISSNQQMEKKETFEKLEQTIPLIHPKTLIREKRFQCIYWPNSQGLLKHSWVNYFFF